MSQYEEVHIVLMPQSYKVIFCYYGIDEITINKFKRIYGEDFFKNSKPILKVYEVKDETHEEIQTVYLDDFADNWYINVNKANIFVYVKLGRVTTKNEFISIATSNTIATPHKPSNIF